VFLFEKDKTGEDDLIEECWDMIDGKLIKYHPETLF